MDEQLYTPNEWRKLSEIERGRAHRAQRIQGYQAVLNLAASDPTLSAALRRAGIDVPYVCGTCGARVERLANAAVCYRGHVAPWPTIVPTPIEPPLAAMRRAYDGFTPHAF